VIPYPNAQMDPFLKLYGFCRNISFTTFVAGVAFWFKMLGVPDMALQPGRRP
jgi:hypothetical protein